MSVDKLPKIHTWYVVWLGSSQLQLRNLVLILAITCWVLLAGWETKAHILAATAFNLVALSLVTFVSSSSRTVSLWSVTTLFVIGAAMMGVAGFAGNEYRLLAGDAGIAFRPLAMAFVEELLKLTPIIILLIGGVRFSNWTLGAVDLLLMGSATGAGFAVVEDAFRHAQTNMSPLSCLMPGVEMMSNSYVLAGHCIWTGLAAAGFGIAVLLRHHWRWCTLAVLGCFTVSVLDHACANYALAGARDFWLIGTGYLAIVGYFGMFALALFLDRKALATKLPDVPEFRQLSKKEKPDALTDFWGYVLDRRRLLYSNFKFQKANVKDQSVAALVVSILMQDLINFHRGTAKAVSPAMDLSLEKTQAVTAAQKSNKPTLLPSSWDEDGGELDLPERYQINELISEGGMGAIYRGKHLFTGGKVAIKVLHPHIARQEVNQLRFKQEAQAASALNHPGLVKVSDYGQTPKNVPFLVMELIEGANLSQVIREHGCVPVERLLPIFVQASDALAHAHKQGVLHRDIKPSNMVLTKTEDGGDFIHIVDFGIAKFLNDGQQELTKTGDIMGSPLYMSPEQCMGSPLDTRSDIYSLGCVIYEALTGQAPFLGTNAVQTIFKHLNEMPVRPRELRRDLNIPQELEGVLFRTLQKDPAKRYATMDELRNDLEYVHKTLTGRRLETLWSSDGE